MRYFRPVWSLGELPCYNKGALLRVEWYDEIGSQQKAPVRMDKIFDRPAPCLG